MYACVGRDSDWLRVGRSGDRILMGAMEPTQLPVKWVPGRGVDHPPTSTAAVKEGVELYLYSPSGPSLPIMG
jgi:hypothetical protein